MRKVVAILLLAGSSSAAIAHDSPAKGDASQWSFDPWIAGFLAALLLCYLAGTLILLRRSLHVSRSRFWQAFVFAAGWLSLAGALMSPLHSLGERLLSFHMIEHEILMAISAPLLVLARPLGVLLWGLPGTLRLRLGRSLRMSWARNSWNALTKGSSSTVLHGIAIWAWHAPTLFDAALTNPLLHRLQHVSFFATAVLFWWSVLRRNGTGVAAWHVFATMVHTSALGALMTLAPRVLYRTDAAAAFAWGMSPLEDQQLAGIVMWVPAGTIYAGIAMFLLAVWISDAGKQARKLHVAHPA
jgi:putative membrane protein